MKQEGMEKKDIKTNDDRQIFLEYTQTHIHSLARTHLSFSVLFQCNLYFSMFTFMCSPPIWCVHCTAYTRHMYALLHDKFIFCSLLVPFILSPSFSFFHFFVIIFRYILSHDLRQYHNMTLELNSTWISSTKGKSSLFVSFVQVFFYDFFLMFVNFYLHR